MGIDPNQLAPWAQKQIAEKLLAQQREKAKNAEIIKKTGQKQNKYHSENDERISNDGKVLKFDSRKEGRRFDELMLMLKSGTIRDLHLQQNFTLQEGYTLPNGNRVKPIIYRADFVYEKRVIRQYQFDGGCSYEEVEEWEKVIEDVKSRATKTRVYELKKKLMREKFGEITEV